MNSSLLKTVGMFLGIIIIIALTSFGLLKDFGSGNGGLKKDEVEKIVAEYIQKNPQAIIDSVNKLQHASAEEEEKKTQANVTEKLKEIENDPTSPVAGNPKGDVVIVEFFDYSCGYCKKVFPSVVKLIDEDKNIKAVFKEFPILGPNSELAARAALAVYAISPQKYFEFHKELMGGERISGQESINAVAGKLGIDVAKMEKKMNSQEVAKVIASDRELASTLGLHGTPAFIIGGVVIPGAADYDQLKELVASARAKKSGKI